MGGLANFFLPRLAWSHNLSISASCVAGITEKDHCAHYCVRWGLTFCSGWPQTSILLVSASQVARVTGVSHWHPGLYDLKFKVIKNFCFL
jgi:hypothetical protein